METTNTQNLNIKIIRMWGIFLIPQFFMALRLIYFRIRFISANSFDVLMDCLPNIFDLPLQLLTLFFTIYFLFYGRKAADILQYFMNKWQLQYRHNLAAYAIRILGLTLLFKLIKDISATLILIILELASDLSFIDSISPVFAFISILTLIILLFSSWYLLFRGEFILKILHRTDNNINSNELKAVHTWGLFLLPHFLNSTIGLISLLIYYNSLDMEFNSESKISFFMNWLSYLYFSCLTFYLLLYGKGAARLLQHFMNKWLPQYKNDAAAYFIRILGMYYVLNQIVAIAKLIQSITTKKQLHEFKEIYNLPGILSLTSLPQIVTTTLWLIAIWYLLFRGQFILNFIHRQAKP